MPNYPPTLTLPPAILRPWLEDWALGATLSCIAYGTVVVLFLNCFQLLCKTSHTLSKHTRRFLYAFTIVMFLFSTADCVLTIGGLFKRMKIPFDQDETDWTDAAFWGDPLSSMGETLIVLSIWGADGFMLWRCVMLYEGISRPLKIAFYALVTLITLNGLGFGMYGLLTPGTFVPVSRYQTVSAVSYSTMASNSLIAGLIVGRILYHQRYLRQVFGKGYGSVYTRVLTMCVESAALIVILHAAYLGLANQVTGVTYSRPWYVLILLKSFVPISVIAPLLIIFRVARGKALVSNPAKSFAGGVANASVRRIETLRFQTNQRSPIITENSTNNDNRTQEIDTGSNVEPALESGSPMHEVEEKPLDQGIDVV